MPNWACGQMIITGERDNVLSFLRHSLDCGILNEEWDETGEYCAMNLARGNPWMKGTHRCFCEEPFIEYDNGVGRIYMECAWDLDSEGMKKLSGKYHVKLSLEVEEGGMCFCHRYECEDGRELEDVTWDIRWDEDRQEYVVAY